MAATKVHSKDINSMPGNINEAQPLVNPNIKGMNAQSVYRPRDPSVVAKQSPLIRDVSDFSWLYR